MPGEGRAESGRGPSTQWRHVGRAGDGNQATEGRPRGAGLPIIPGSGRPCHGLDRFEDPRDCAPSGRRACPAAGERVAAGTPSPRRPFPRPAPDGSYSSACGRTSPTRPVRRRRPGCSRRWSLWGAVPRCRSPGSAGRRRASGRSPRGVGEARPGAPFLPAGRARPGRRGIPHRSAKQLPTVTRLDLPTSLWTRRSVAWTWASSPSVRAARTHRPSSGEGWR